MGEATRLSDAMSPADRDDLLRCLCNFFYRFTVLLPLVIVLSQTRQCRHNTLGGRKVFGCFLHVALVFHDVAKKSIGTVSKM